MATKESKTNKGNEIYKHVDATDGIPKKLKPSDGKKPAKKAK